MDCASDEVKVYDPLIHTSVNDDTQTVIPALINSKSPHVKMKLMNVAKQSGGTECGLCICYSHNNLLGIQRRPTCVVFDKAMLRPFLVECFEKKCLQPFPIVKDEKQKQLLQSKYALFVFADLTRLRINVTNAINPIIVTM